MVAACRPAASPGAKNRCRGLVQGGTFEADWLQGFFPVMATMSSCSLPVLSGLILLLAALLLTGIAWVRRRPRGVEMPVAWRDPRSGLYGRAVLLELLGRELALAARLRHPVAVLMIELDAAHPPAELQLLARRLAGRVRSYDLLGQWDERRFLIALPDSDVGAALVLAQDLCDGQARHRQEAGAGSPATSLSVGVHARTPDLRDNSDELALAMTAAAQRALDATRSDGPGRVEVEP